MLKELQMSGDEDFSDLKSIDDALSDPVYSPFQADEEATNEEEALLSEVMTQIGDLFYGEGAASKVASMIQNSGKELFEVAPEVAKPLLTRAHEISNQIDPELTPVVMFGEGGVVAQINDMIFELAQQIGLPEAESEDQYIASLTAIYNAIGVHIDETDDKASRQQIAEMAVESVMNSPEGASAAEAAPQQTPVAAGVSEGLRGGLLS